MVCRADTSAAEAPYAPLPAAWADPNAKSDAAVVARLNIFFLLGTVGTSIAAVAVSTHGFVFEPCSCVAAAYVVSLACLQLAYLEWPHLDWHFILVLASAIALFVLPTVLNEYGLWMHVGGWVFPSAAALLAIVAYTWLVRGPSYAPRVGTLSGKVCIITGCNSGIGLETARAMVKAGAIVFFACRSEKRALEAMKKIAREAAPGKVQQDQLRFLELDLSSLDSVRNFVSCFQASGLPLHHLILNAGIMPSVSSLTKDGLDMTLASNHFGHFLLTNLLLPQLLATETAEGVSGHPPRVVVLSSNISYEPREFDFGEAVKVEEDRREAFLARPYSMFPAYGQSKLANVMFAHELARRLRRDHGSRIPVSVVHPGEVMTEVVRDMPPTVVAFVKLFGPVVSCMMKTSPQGCFCTLYAATAAETASSTDPAAIFYMRLRASRPPPASCDEAANFKLWEISERLTGLHGA